MSEDQAQSTPQSEVTSTSSVPTWFWIVSVVMLIWNLMGLAAFAMIMMMLGNKDSLVDAGFNEASNRVDEQHPDVGKRCICGCSHLRHFGVRCTPDAKQMVNSLAGFLLGRRLGARYLCFLSK